MVSQGAGIDILEIKRFASFKKSRKDHFLSKTFSKQELEYCFSFKDPAPHLAGTFAAKEAAFKAWAADGISLESFEIRRSKDGRPSVWIKNRPQKSLLISISHTATTAVAVAFKR